MTDRITELELENAKLRECLAVADYALRVTKRDIKNWFNSEDAKGASVAFIDDALEKMKQVA